MHYFKIKEMSNVLNFLSNFPNTVFFILQHSRCTWFLWARFALLAFKWIIHFLPTTGHKSNRFSKIRQKTKSYLKQLSQNIWIYAEYMYIPHAVLSQWICSWGSFMICDYLSTNYMCCVCTTAFLALLSVFQNWPSRLLLCSVLHAPLTSTLTPFIIRLVFAALLSLLFWCLNCSKLSCFKKM